MSTKQNIFKGFGSSFSLKSMGLGVAAAVLMTISGGAVTSSEAEAGRVVKGKAIGIGFAHSRHRAKRRAIKAWRKAVKRSYGRSFAEFRSARNRRISCDYIGYDRFARKSLRQLRRHVPIATVGNPNSPWTCTAKARPTKYVFEDRHPNYKKSAKGIGFHRSEAGARGLAVRAWTRAVRRAYGRGYSNFSRAKNRNIRCDYIGRNYSRKSRGFYEYGRRGQVIDQAGNPEAPWTCTASGRPRYSNYYY